MKNRSPWWRHRVLDRRLAAARSPGTARPARSALSEPHLARSSGSPARAAGTRRLRVRSMSRKKDSSASKWTSASSAGFVAHDVAVEPAGPARLVEHDVEQGAAVVGPRRGWARRWRSSPASSVSGRQILHEQGERLRAARVHRVGQQPVVGAHLERAQPEVGVAVGERVQVEQHLLGGASGSSRPAAEDRDTAPRPRSGV